MKLNIVKSWLNQRTHEALGLRRKTYFEKKLRTSNIFVDDTVLTGYVSQF